MRVETLLNVIDSGFYTGVPDSQLKALCDCLMDTYGTDRKHHIIAANEGNAAALAAGYHLATGEVPVVYLQNSGLGNIINPVVSLLNEKVYAIPCLFIVGWRGEPGVHDEPQHIFQGEITPALLEQIGIPFFILDQETTIEQISTKMEEYRQRFKEGRQCALVVRKGALAYSGHTKYGNSHPVKRENTIERIVQIAKDDLIVSTTGKISRELFELRKNKKQGHCRDFLTVGSMGHSSSIALGIALQRPDFRVWCLDGDGAALMHMGSIALIGVSRPQNLVHVVLNNEAHESVGGMPTAAGQIDLPGVARACGYPAAASVSTLTELEKKLDMIKNKRQLTFLEVQCSLDSRNDLGRPDSAPIENKRAFMDYIRGAN